VAAAIVFVAALGPGAASAAAPIITENVTPASPNGANNWYVTDVTIGAFGVDLQGQTEVLPRDSDCDGAPPVTSDTAGTSLTCTVVTEGVDGGTTSRTVTIKRDATNPNLAPQITPATLVLNGPGVATPNATDATSGVASESCGVVTDTVGAHSLQCTATDDAGNQRMEMVPYTVEPNGPAASAAATKGDGQVAYVTQQFSSALVVTVTDTQGNPVPGETVSFRAPLSGASADLSRRSDVTNANGIASIRAFANNKAGGYVVRGKVPGAGSARFNLRNAPAPYFADGFSRGLRKWKRTGSVSIATGAGQPAPSALLRASGGKTFATHSFGDTYATACASASVRLNSLGNEAVALLRFRGAGDSGISRVSVETDRELFVRNDRVGGVKLSGQRLPLGAWHELELCTHVGGKGSISLFLDGSKIVSWRQRLGDRRIAALHLIENDVKTFSVNVDNVLVDGKPGTPA
jgi:hypothetical protein